MATPVISGTTRTNLGPLTTNSWTYTCTEVIQECSDCDNGWAAQTCIDGVVTDNQECWPPRATNVPKTSGALDAWGVYSPGIVCPGGYTSVATAIQSSSDFEFQYPLKAKETAIGCCPTGGFSAVRDVFNTQTCLQFRPTTSFLVGSCGTAGPTFTPFSVGGTLNSTRYPNFSVNAPFLMLVYQASDLPATSTSSSTSSSSSSSSNNNGTPSATSSSDEQHSRSGKGSGLSPGAAAGIAVGVTLGAILIAAAAAFRLWRGRQKRHAGASPRQGAEFLPPEFKPLGPAQLDADNQNTINTNAVPQWRYDGAVPSSMVGVINPNHPAELGGSARPAELGSPPSLR
ncbi:hypothetical protein F4825DRAFT_310081 [Nemania diffusa]|nr:hypothetical protein F4825DRAFT_310081 [Nemania diffusa]